jgi:O-antigen ligase
VALLAALTALATVFAADLRTSGRHLAGVLLMLALPIAMDVADDARRGRLLTLALAASGTAIAIAGLWQFAHGGDDLENRIHATLSTYMTFSALVMIASGILLAMLLEGRGRVRWIGLAAAVPLASMLLTFTRNAYVGMLAALLAYLLLRRPRGLLILIPALVLVVALLPAEVRGRMRSIGDLSDPSNRDRVSMWHAGMRMVGDFPVLGLGPEMVKYYYPLYRDPDSVHWSVPHLHNNAIQIAAASGVPAAAAYVGLAILPIAASARRLRRERRPEVAASLAAVLLASIALFVAGLFEYNFGDTEVEMATLLLWALPFSAATAPGREGASV